MSVETWSAASGGAWNSSINWTPAGYPTSIIDAVINGPATTYQVVTGPGNSASLTLLGDTTLSGAFNTGAVSVGTASAAGALKLAAGSVLDATAVALLSGALQLNGAGARLAVSGAVTLGGAHTSYNYVPDTLALVGGASLQAASVALLPFTGNGLGFNIISIDSASSLEIGSLGAAAAGRLTVDAGRMLSGAGSVSAAGIINNGTILAQNGALTIVGAVSGSGQFQIGAGATLSGNGAEPVSFLANTGTLGVFVNTALAAATGTTAYSFGAQGTISGFGLGDSIAITTLSSNTGVTSATYTAGAVGTTGIGLGTLTFASNNTVLGTLTLAGNYAGYTFQAAPTPSAYTYTVTLVPVVSGGGTASLGTTAPDAYTWTAGGSAAWDDATRWRDVTTGATPSGIAPGSNDSVTITGPAASYQVVTGPGNSASLTLLGETTLSGAFNTGAVAVGSDSATGALNIAAGSVLNAGMVTVLSGSLQLNGAGARLAVSGAVTLGGSHTGYNYVPDTLTLVGGASLQAASVALLSFTGNGLGADSISVDSASSLEIGSLGVTTAGRLTIDAGHTLSGTGSVTAAGIINNGIILAQNGALVVGGPGSGSGNGLSSGIVSGIVSGTGQFQIGAGATLSGNGAEPVSFLASTGTLGVSVNTVFAAATGATSYTLGAQGTISGFGLGDSIAITTLSTNIAVTSVTYTPGLPGTAGLGAAGLGTLTIASNSTVLGTLTLAGNYAGYAFQAAPTPSSTTYAVTLVPAATGGGTAVNPLFDAAYYLAHNPDVAAARVDPYQHYLTQGWKEGRNPSAGFDTNDYLAANPDVKAAGVNPLLHYTDDGKAEGRAAFAVPSAPPDPLVDAAYYYAHNPDVRAAGVDAGAHYLPNGWLEGRDPNALFDTNYYLTQNPDVAAAGIDPLLHFEANGWKEGRQPSLLFSDAKYLAANPDVAAAGIDPLAHFVTYGQNEGRAAFLTGGTAPADVLVNATYYDQQLGATLIPTGTAAAQQAAYSYDATGWQKGLNPDAFFNTQYYLSHNPDVAAAHVDPLLHYETYGWKEGRDPSAQFSTTKYLAAYSDVRAAGLDPLLHYVAYGQAEGRQAFSV